MGILKELFLNSKKQRVAEEEAKFVALPAKKKEEICKKILQLDKNGVKNIIAKKPYILPQVISDLNLDNLTELVDLATKNGVSVYDLIDKSKKISNEAIVNIAVKNQPELVLELDDMPQLQDLINVETLVEAFTKNPEVIFSECKALNKKIMVTGTKRDGTEGTRHSKLKTQLQRAMNLFFRPESYKGNGFDEFAKSIADQIDAVAFMKKIFGSKMTTRSTTAANEMLKREPEKGSVVPAKTLHNWNNRVLYTIPNQAKRKVSKRDGLYAKYTSHLFGLLHNPALNTFSEEEKTRLVKKCVSIVPDLYNMLLGSEAFAEIVKKLTVQLTTYETFKKMGLENEAKDFLASIGEEQSKSVLSRAKANVTRRTNKKSKVKKQKTVETPATLTETL